MTTHFTVLLVDLSRNKTIVKDAIELAASFNLVGRRFHARLGCSKGNVLSE